MSTQTWQCMKMFFPTHSQRLTVEFDIPICCDGKCSQKFILCNKRLTKEQTWHSDTSVYWTLSQCNCCTGNIFVRFILISSIPLFRSPIYCKSTLETASLLTKKHVFVCRMKSRTKWMHIVMLVRRWIRNERKIRKSR